MTQGDVVGGENPVQKGGAAAGRRTQKKTDWCGVPGAPRGWACVSRGLGHERARGGVCLCTTSVVLVLVVVTGQRRTEGHEAEGSDGGPEAECFDVVGVVSLEDVEDDDDMDGEIDDVEESREDKAGVLVAA
eukprot:CAMPEP_0197428606 /NCGR_PEP_ID=MMETSP1170-20131217/41548_1 /TAXON_ID=54406 /ORGANISM="Sarcinochrysis sp, Strain CCMP770" /LENGTH=131 /DNA_ID=CAMNT_0042956381 /DNA_START=24 /DNA_END=416 /DNA_ORIENTATION=-